MSVDEGEPVETFRLNVPHMLRWWAGWAALTCVVSAVPFAFDAFRGLHARDIRGALIAFPLVFVAIAAVGLLASALAWIVYPVTVSSDGIRCCDVFGRMRTSRWDDVVSIRPYSLYGLRYLAIESRTVPHGLTLPMWIDDMPRFVLAIEARAGADHVLARSLREAI